MSSYRARRESLFSKWAQKNCEGRRNIPPPNPSVHGVQVCWTDANASNFSLLDLGGGAYWYSENKACMAKKEIAKDVAAGMWHCFSEVPQNENAPMRWDIDLVVPERFNITQAMWDEMISDVFLKAISIHFPGGCPGVVEKEPYLTLTRPSRAKIINKYSCTECGNELSPQMQCKNPKHDNILTYRAERSTGGDVIPSDARVEKQHKVSAHIRALQHRDERYHTVTGGGPFVTPEQAMDIAETTGRLFHMYTRQSTKWKENMPPLSLEDIQDAVDRAMYNGSGMKLVACAADGRGGNCKMVSCHTCKGKVGALCDGRTGCFTCHGIGKMVDKRAMQFGGVYDSDGKRMEAELEKLGGDNWQSIFRGLLRTSIRLPVSVLPHSETVEFRGLSQQQRAPGRAELMDRAYIDLLSVAPPGTSQQDLCNNHFPNNTVVRRITDDRSRTPHLADMRANTNKRFPDARYITDLNLVEVLQQWIRSVWPTAYQSSEDQDEGVCIEKIFYCDNKNTSPVIVHLTGFGAKYCYNRLPGNRGSCSDKACLHRNKSTYIQINAPLKTQQASAMQRCFSNHIGRQTKHRNRIKCSEYKGASKTLPADIASRLYLMCGYKVAPKMTKRGLVLLTGGRREEICKNMLKLAGGLRQSVGLPAVDPQSFMESLEATKTMSEEDKKKGAEAYEAARSRLVTLRESQKRKRAKRVSVATKKKKQQMKKRKTSAVAVPQKVGEASQQQMLAHTLVRTWFG